jgi:hypothetical protein
MVLAYLAEARKLGFPRGRERVAALYLSGDKVVGRRWLSTGGKRTSTVNIPNVIAQGRKLQADGVVLVHNHPSGSLQPSIEDLTANRAIKRACQDAGIPLRAHFIATTGGHVRKLRGPASKQPNCCFADTQLRDVPDIVEHHAEPHQIAKEIQKEDEPYASALSRAWKKIRGQTYGESKTQARKTATKPVEKAAPQKRVTRKKAVERDTVPTTLRALRSKWPAFEFRILRHFGKKGARHLGRVQYTAVVDSGASDEVLGKINTGAHLRMFDTRSQAVDWLDGQVKRVPKSWPPAPAPAAPAPDEWPQPATDAEIIAALTAVGELEPKPAAMTAPGGYRTTATGPDPAKKYEFVIALVDLDEIKPSHLDNFAPNPDYPPELQPRIRERAASQQQISKIAANLDADALILDSGTLDRGMPIVGPDMAVESGNGRIMAIRAARTDYPASINRYRRAVRDAVAEKYPEMGGNKLARQGDASWPVLVRVRQTQVDRVEFAGVSNEATTLTMSPLEQALQDAGRISDTAMGNIEVGETQSVDQALQSSSNRALVVGFLESMGENERAALVGAAGELNIVGLMRIKAALFAKVYPGEAGMRLTKAFVESLDPILKNMESALFASLPAMARAEGLIRSGDKVADLSLADDMARVVDKLAQLKATQRTAEDYIRQASAFDRDLNPAQERLLVFVEANGRSAKVLREFLKEYAGAVEDSPHPDQGSMFGDAQESKAELLDRLIESHTKRQTGGLFELIEARQTAGLADPLKDTGHWSTVRFAESRTSVRAQRRGLRGKAATKAAAVTGFIKGGMEKFGWDEEAVERAFHALEPQLHHAAETAMHTVAHNPLLADSDVVRGVITKRPQQFAEWLQGDGHRAGRGVRADMVVTTADKKDITRAGTALKAKYSFEEPTSEDMAAAGFQLELIAGAPEPGTGLAPIRAASSPDAPPDPEQSRLFDPGNSIYPQNAAEEFAEPDDRGHVTWQRSLGWVESTKNVTIHSKFPQQPPAGYIRLEYVGHREVTQQGPNYVYIAQDWPQTTTAHPEGGFIVAWNDTGRKGRLNSSAHVKARPDEFTEQARLFDPGARIAAIDRELSRLQGQYERKLDGGGRSAMVPPAIKQDFLNNIATKMDRLEEEKSRLQEAASPEGQARLFDPASRLSVVLEDPDQQASLGRSFDDVPYGHRWVRMGATGAHGVGVEYRLLKYDGEDTGWFIENRAKQFRALRPWALYHPDGSYVFSPEEQAFSTLAEAQRVGLAAHEGTLPLRGPTTVKGRWQRQVKSFPAYVVLEDPEQLTGTALTEPPGVSPDDIPYELAERAYIWNSQVPEKRAAAEQAEWVSGMRAVWKQLHDRAQTPEEYARILDVFGQLRDAELSARKAILRKRSGLASWLVTGRSGFPVRQQEKKHDSYEKAVGEWIEASKKRLKRALDQIRPLSSGPISSDDPEAVRKLQERLEKAERLQNTMTAANKIMRLTKKTQAEKIELIAEVDGMTQQTAEKMFEKDFAGRLGFPAYELSNNRQEIKRIKERIAALERETATRASGDQPAIPFEAAGAIIEENNEDNRLRIFFDGKPEKPIRDDLKRNGFRWSPTARATSVIRSGAWQRQLNDAARLAAHRVLKTAAPEPEAAPAPAEPAESHMTMQQLEAKWPNTNFEIIRNRDGTYSGFVTQGATHLEKQAINSGGGGHRREHRWQVIEWLDRNLDLGPDLGRPRGEGPRRRGKCVICGKTLSRHLDVGNPHFLDHKFVGELDAPVNVGGGLVVGTNAGRVEGMTAKWAAPSKRGETEKCAKCGESLFAHTNTARPKDHKFVDATKPNREEADPAPAGITALKKKPTGSQLQLLDSRKGGQWKIVPHTRSMDIRNIEQLPRGLNARYLEVMESHTPGVYIAVRWRRSIPPAGPKGKNRLGDALVDFRPTKLRDPGPAEEPASIYEAMVAIYGD